MKLSVILELLLIFVFLALVSSKSVKKQKNTKKGIQNRNGPASTEENGVAKYCKCTEALCNCCRDFQVSVLNLQGPGCASLKYLNGDRMSISLSFGKKVITNRVLSGRKPTPVCMPLPGGVSKFCGRVYNIGRAGEDFKACLGLELQSKSTVEAAVRVSCFKFGPRGVTSEQADPLPLVPQDEKVDDDDDEDDDDDDFGLSDDDDEDDDDDDDDGELDAVNDVGSSDYTGFSLLGEDLLGEFFGSSGSKKPNKPKKKQAPTPAPTPTTKRPRPSRRPTRPLTKLTTPRNTITRSTTVKIRPASRRPTRRPSRRPTRPRPIKKPTTASSAEASAALSAETSFTSPTILSTASPPTAPELSIIGIQTTERLQPMNTNVLPLQPVSIATQTPSSVLSLTTSTSKPVTNFEDPGIQMSLAHITGQLSSMPVTEIIQTNGKFEDTITSKEQTTYEKVHTITPKSTTANPMSSSSESSISEDMVQIVQSLDSHSEEQDSLNDMIKADESRTYTLGYEQPTENPTVLDESFESLILPKKKQRSKEFDFDDLDVIGLTEIGESVGDQLGLFGRRKRQNKQKEHRVKNEDNKNEPDYYADMLGLDMLDDMGIARRSSNTGNKKDRRRQNKMMRGDWSQV